MEQRDYIKRQIEQIGILLGRMLSTLLGLRSGGDTGSAIQQICGELKDELDLDIDMLASADAETVIKELQTKGFDYDLLIRLRGVIDSMAASLPENDRRRQSLTDLSDKLAAGTQAGLLHGGFLRFPVNHSFSLALRREVRLYTTLLSLPSRTDIIVGVKPAER